MMLMSRGNRKLIYPDVLQMFKIGIIASFSWEMSNFFKASMRAVQWICFSLSPDPAKWGRANKQPNNKRKYHNIPVSCLLVSSEIKSIYCWPASANIYSIFYVTYLFFFSITVACQHAAEGKKYFKSVYGVQPWGDSCHFLDLVSVANIWPRLLLNTDCFPHKHRYRYFLCLIQAAVLMYMNLTRSFSAKP